MAESRPERKLTCSISYDGLQALEFLVLQYCFLLLSLEGMNFEGLLFFLEFHLFGEVCVIQFCQAVRLLNNERNSRSGFGGLSARGVSSESWKNG